METFEQTLVNKEPSAQWSNALQALWFDAKGHWEQAHDVVQDGKSADEAWVHAYLHRKEGDMSNADYWYRRAGKERPDLTFKGEWDQIVGELYNDYQVR